MGVLGLPGEILRESPDVLKGVGPARSKALADIGISTLGDLVLRVPLRYEDWRPVYPFESAATRENAAIAGRILSTEKRWGSVPGTLITLMCRGRRAEGTLFGRRGFESQLEKGKPLLAFGRWEMAGPKKIRAAGIEIQSVDAGGGRVRPIYGASKSISSNMIAKSIVATLDLETEMPRFPRELREITGYTGVRALLEDLHRPSRVESGINAMRWMGFLEMLVFQLGINGPRSVADRGIEHRGSGRLTGPFLDGLPFSPTPGQLRAMASLESELASSDPMYHLVQGDVASGKTIVAIWATLRAVESGGRVVWMVPTRVLADQHRDTLRGFLEPLGVTVERFASDDPPVESQVLVGTQAVLSGNLPDPTLVVIDEQQRFGVQQRGMLQEVDPTPDVLLISATPIPRTMARCLWGDLKVTTLESRPDAPRSVRTFVVDGSEREKVYEFARRQAAAGIGVFVVCPNISDDGGGTAGAAAESVARVLVERYPELEVRCIHGAVDDDCRSVALAHFARGEVDILVCTTLVGVGIDIPRARVMVVECAERFGLTELHQLRGRIGRDGRRAGFFAIISGEQHRPRIGELERLEDGMSIAKADLRLRGMGDFFSRNQHGGPPFAVSDVATSPGVIRRASNLSRRILSGDPELAKPDNAGLRSLLEASLPDEDNWIHVR